MSQNYFGSFEYRGECYEFDEAVAEWDGKSLFVSASGNELLVFFAGIPFGPVESFSQLNGKRYSGGGGDSVFSEGLIRLGEKSYAVEGTPRISCIAASGEKQTVAIEFDLEIALNNGRSRRARGGIKCALGKIPTPWPDPCIDEA